MNKMGFQLVLVMFILLTAPGCEPGMADAQAPAPLSEIEQAEITLISFFDTLHTGKYHQAVKIYGGSYETLIEYNPAIDPGNYVELMEAACSVNGFNCLKVKNSNLHQQVSDREFIFAVEFEQADGSLFALGTCCGEPTSGETDQTQFLYTVTKSAQSGYQVKEMPQYNP